MRSVKIITPGALLVFALLLWLPAQTASAQTGVKYYVVSNTENVYVRHEPVGMVLGTLFGKDERTGSVRHDRLAVVFISPKGWAWGRAEGNVDRCGWVKLWEGESNTPSGKVYLKPLNGGTVKVQTGCGAHRTIDPDTFLSGHPCGVPLSNGKMDACPAKLNGMNIRIYGNLKGSRLLDERKFSPLARNRGPGKGVKRRIRYRYITNNGHFVMVRSPYGTDRWGFIKRADICLPGDSCP